MKKRKNLFHSYLNFMVGFIFPYIFSHNFTNDCKAIDATPNENVVGTKSKMPKTDKSEANRSCNQTTH